MESEQKEFKLSLSQLDRALESIVAILNKHQKGTILFGVDDNGNKVGINKSDKKFDK